MLRRNGGSSASDGSAWWGRIGNRPWILAALVAVIVLVWLVAILATPSLRFVVLTPKAKTGFEVSLALLRLFVALVLVLVPEESERDRLRWVAAGFGILGLGGLAFGYLLPLVTEDDLRQALYGSLLIRSIGIAAIAVGLVLARPPRPSRRTAGLLALGVIAISVLVALAPDRLPPLTNVTDLDAAAADDGATLGGLTTWHWAPSIVPLGLATAAAVGVTRRSAGRPNDGWIVTAMVLMAGSQLHTMFWPSAYSPILTTASLLRLAFTVVVALGAVLTLRRVADERAALLAAEADLARVRADFAAMVAHELASPVTAIRGYTAMLATGALDREAQIEAATAITGEAELLATLIGDVRAAAAVEREDFAIHPVAVEVDVLMAEAAAFARTLPGGHPVDTLVASRVRVVGDPERIAQVLRNLIGNVSKHTPPGTPIELRAERRDDRVWLAVVDRGPGIAPEEVGHVFEKYRRGWAARRARVPGAGLGLYLSRRIVQAHGGELKVEPTPGGGATFLFELAVAE